MALPDDLRQETITRYKRRARAAVVTPPGSSPSAWPRSRTRADYWPISHRAAPAASCGPVVSLDLTFVFLPVSPLARHGHELARPLVAPAAESSRAGSAGHRRTTRVGYEARGLSLGGDKTAARTPRDTSAAPARAKPMCRPTSLDATQTAILAGIAAQGSDSGGRCSPLPEAGPRGGSAGGTDTPVDSAQCSEGPEQALLRNFTGLR